MADQQIQVDVTEVTVYKSSSDITTFATKDKTTAKIEAGLVGNTPKVIVERKDGTRIMFVGFPFYVETRPKADK